MITTENLIELGFKAKEDSFVINLKRSRVDSPKELTVKFNKKLNNFYLVGEATKKALTIERMNNVIKGIELINGKSFKNLIIEQ